MADLLAFPVLILRTRLPTQHRRVCGDGIDLCQSFQGVGALAELRSGDFPADREIYREFSSDASEGWPDDSSKAEPFEPITKNFPTTQNREFLVARRDLANYQEGFWSRFEELRPGR